jgi:EAL domain-containing protein (putative c-di-GMP-specific phosphodiesterase class I)
LNNQNFELYFQPQLNLKNATLCGAEALLRWNHPSGELVSPAEFIPIIEHTGLILPVGRWVIRDALEKLKQWRLQGLSLSRVAVNVSALQLQNDQLLDYLNGLLLELDLQPQDLEVEITESVFVDNAVVPKVLQDMHQQGFYLALDDFGTGYSSLSYLTRLPFNKIKLDRSFVAKIETEPSSRAMAKSLVALAKTLGFEVTAEGVENIEQLRFLMENGCDQAQGYFIGRPVPNKLFIEQLSHFDQQTLLQNLKFKAQV